MFSDYILKILVSRGWMHFSSWIGEYTFILNGWIYRRGGYIKY